jgi:DNA-binding HxlR family transcriptional regulator
VATYGQYCPVARAAEVLGDRWTLLIMRELMQGAGGFNELLRGLPGISRSVLAQRMRALEHAGVVERRVGGAGRTLGYRLAPSGRDLQPVLDALGEWGAAWAFTEPTPEELEPSLLIVWIARRVTPDRLPAERTVVRFDFRRPRARFWLVLEPHDVSVCLRAPGFDSHLVVTAETREMYRVYSGETSLGEAMGAGAVSIEGPAALRRAFAGWFAWSRFAPAVRAAPEHRAELERTTAPESRVSVIA